MVFNVKKCGVLHVGYNNPRRPYTMQGEQVETVHEVKDLGIKIDQSITPGKQCIVAAKKANSILGMIKRNISNKNP